MARNLVCAVAVVCAACQQPAAGKVADEALIENHARAEAEGQMGKKEAPRAELAAPAPAPAAVSQKVQKSVAAPMFGASKGGGEMLSLQGSGVGGGGVGGAIGIGNIGTKGRGGGTGQAFGYGGLGLKGISQTSSFVVNRRLGDRNQGSSNGVGTFANPGVNAFTTASEDRLSTFAADVDTASYTLARRVILEGRLPPEDSVRVEEFLNYFRYQYPAPTDAPLGVTMELAPSPFTAGHQLLKVGVQGKQLAMHERKIAHLTFLVDVSGSMQSPDKLPLAKRSLRMLVDQLRDGDTVALVTYAGGVKLVLPHTGMEQKARIHAAIEELTAGGGTGMASGIELAYQQAEKVLDSKSYSRVIILSDGDANIGPSGPDALIQLIRGHVKEGVTVTTAGFGVGNYRDELMEKFADAGNGNHFYIDSLWQAHRVFVEQLGSTLEVIAQDVKLQVEFDPAQVKSYRLIGYENRDVADRDFRNDKVDGGEIGSGHSVTALYELVLNGPPSAGLATVRIRAKKPRGTEASEWVHALKAESIQPRFAAASNDFRFATAVMGAAELFRRSTHAQGWKLADVQAIAKGSAGDSAERKEFVALLDQAEAHAILASR